MSKLMFNGRCYSYGGEPLVQPIIYSEEEREVGVWTDGKPLYERTFVFSSEVVVNQGTWVNTNIDGTGIDNIINVICRSGGASFGMLGARNNNNIIQLYSPTTVGVYGTTLQYTKTTDTPGSGKYAPSGVPAVHYSENEQVVGTWVDGSTLYEKTVVNSSTLVVGNNSISIPTDATSIVSATGIFVSGTYSDPLNIYAGSTYGTLALDSLDATSHTLRVRIGSDYSSLLAGAYVYITICYTKTTS